MEYLGYFAAVLMGVSLGLIGGGGSILTVPILVYLFSQNPLIATTGFVGAGGGFLIIPALVILLKLPMKMPVGTSLAIIAANSLFGFTISMSEHRFL